MLGQFVAIVSGWITPSRGHLDLWLKKTKQDYIFFNPAKYFLKTITAVSIRDVFITHTLGLLWYK